MDCADSSVGLEVLQDQYERSLEKWSDKLGQAKKDITLYRIESMEARLDGDLLLEDVLEGIHRMEAMQKHIDNRFEGDEPSFKNLAGEAGAELHEALLKLVTHDNDIKLAKEDAIRMLALYKEQQYEIVSSLSHLSAKVEAAEAAVKLRESEQLKKDLHFKKMTQLWQHDLQKQNTELSQARKLLSMSQCDLQSLRLEGEKRITALQQEVDILREEISLHKNSHESSCQSAKVGPSDESTDGETDNTSSHGHFPHDDQREVSSLRRELAALKRDLWSLCTSCDGDSYMVEGRGGTSQEIFYQVSSNLTPTSKREGHGVRQEQSDHSPTSSEGGDEMDANHLIQRVRSQLKQQVDCIATLQQQVKDTKHALRIKKTEVTSLRHTLLENDMAQKGNQHQMQSFMETLSVQVDKLQSDMVTQRGVLPTAPNAATEHHNVDSLSRVIIVVFFHPCGNNINYEIAEIIRL